jgi:hypothetical protein
MLPLERRINRRLARLFSESITDQLKSPTTQSYDRGYAEDLLYHTIGPLTDAPRWAESWTSKSEPPPDFVPGGPAPRWSEDEIIYAYAGDPKLLFSRAKTPTSPHVGGMGGAPLYRLATQVARIYKRDKDQDFISDLYSNGMIALTRAMKPGEDAARSPFISWVHRNILSAMEHGFGGTERDIQARGGKSEKTGLVGIRGVLGETDPQAVRQLAQQVKGQYQGAASHDKHPDNPFGRNSSTFFQLANQYADALDSQDPGAIETSRAALEALSDRISDASTPVLGASTGSGQAISTPDRTSHVGIQSMHAQKEDGASSLEQRLADHRVNDDNSDIAPEEITTVLDIAMKYDVGRYINGLQKRYSRMAQEAGAVFNNGKFEIGGPMGVTELRFVIRAMGPAGQHYPGRGTPRSNVAVPREVKGWWRPGEDPEVEPHTGGLWESIWVRGGFKPMGPTAIAQEMTEELVEFAQLGISTGRQMKTKTGKDGNAVQTAMSKVYVNNVYQSGLLKLKLVAALYREEHADESDTYAEGLNHLSPVLCEQFDKYDRLLIAEAAERMVRLATRNFATNYLCD